jgi:hypothetical protein
VSAIRLVTSPTAWMLGTALAPYASTTTPPSASRATPAAARPMPRVAGARPVASITASTSCGSTPADVRSITRSEPSGRRSIDMRRRVQPQVDPVLDQLDRQVGADVVVEAAQHLLAAVRDVTVAPSPRKIPANSTAM